MSAFVTATGVVVGLFIGLLGGGGSILAVPLLAHGAGLPVAQAVAGALLLVAAAAAAAAVGYQRRGQIDGRVVAAFGSIGLVGSYSGARLAVYIDPRLQMTLFSVLMVIVGLSMLAGGEPGVAWKDRPGRARLAAIALGVGLLTGLLGAGGGFVLVPSMTMLVGLPVRRAIGSSVAVLAITATGALAGHLEHVVLPTAEWLPAALASAVAAVVGSALAQVAPERALRRVFGALVLALAILQIFAK